MRSTFFKSVGGVIAFIIIAHVVATVFTIAEVGDTPVEGFDGSGPHVVGYDRFHSDQSSAVGGAILYSELGCANCHGDSPVVSPRKGPNLVDITQRIDYDWIIDFLKNPQSGRSGSVMPKMTHGLSNDEVKSIVAFLGTINTGVVFKQEKQVNAERGSALYHEKGCVACHLPTADFHSPHGETDVTDFPHAIVHPDLKKKTSLEALSHFLSDPTGYRPDGRMPHIVLESQESQDVAAHLLDFQSFNVQEAKSVKTWPVTDAGMVQKGRALIQKMNCAACHEIPGESSKDIRNLPDRFAMDAMNCLSSQPVEGLPFYDLTDAQRDSLNLYLKNRALDGAAKVHVTLAAMNCYACHERDGIGGPTQATNPWFVGDEGLGDSGRLPPPLTGIGAKLKSEWLQGVLNGKEGRQVRPYVKTQMPAYRHQSAALSKLLESADAKTSEFAVAYSPEILEAGKKLLGTQGGVNCIMCHHWGDQPSLGIPALDISSLHQRLRPDWFHEYLLNPAAYRPGTLMPPLWPGGNSTVPEVLGGNSDLQIAAIWAFIEKGKGLPEGFPDRNGAEFELIPKDRAIIQRTFLKGAGPKAILVGFPGEIHIAYDGLNAHPSLVWKGRFFDAYNTWFSRMAPFESPLGEEVFEFPKPGVKSRFHGYRMDAQGNPIFLIQAGGRNLEESFSVSGGRLYRTISWTKGGAPIVKHPKGVDVKSEGGKNSITFIYSWK